MTWTDIFETLALYEAGNGLAVAVRYVLRDHIRPEWLGSPNLNHALYSFLVSALWTFVTAITVMA